MSIGASPIGATAIGAGGAVSTALQVPSKTDYLFNEDAQFPRSALGAPAARVLATGGDESGTFDMSGDFSTTPTEFYFETPPGRIYNWGRLLVFYQDSGSMDVETFGNGIILTNGIRIEYLDEFGSIIEPIMGTGSITTNGGWSLMSGVDAQLQNWGQGDEGFAVAWDWHEYSNGCFCPPGYRISVTLRDDFSGLTRMFMSIEGLRVR